MGVGGFIAGRVSSTQQPPPNAEHALSPSANATSAPSASADRSPGTTRKTARLQTGATSPAASASSPGKTSTTLRSLILDEDPLKRSQNLVEWLAKLSPAELAQAVDEFRKLNLTEQRMGDYAVMLAAWAKADPLAALTYAREQTGGSFATQTILSTWASSDPDAAIRWATENHQGDGANPFLAGIIRGIAPSDPQRATSLLTSMPRSRERADALDAILPHVLTQGSPAALQWISNLSEDVLRNGALLRSVESLAKTDPEATLKLLMQTPGEARDRRMDDLFSGWTQQDPERALSSATTLQDPSQRANAIRGVITATAIDQPAKALSLMDQHAADVTDRTVQSFIWHTFWKEPNMAVQQIARIQDSQQREQLYRRLVGQWFEQDQASASQWLAKNPLPQNVVDDITRR